MALESLHNIDSQRTQQDSFNDFNPYQLYAPLLPKEEKILDGIFLDESGRKVKINFNKGTTTLGFKFKNGVVLASDSRASSGQYIGSGHVRKLIPINKFLVGTMAGGAADCTYWERVLSKQCRIYELRNRERISVAAASKLLANMLYQYKGYGLSLGVMIGGIDKKGSGLYYVDNDGNRLPGNLFSVGSGSLNAYSILDNGYKFDMTSEEAFELARRSVYHAAHRDAASGGVIRVMHIDEDGWKTISEDDFTVLHDRYQSS